MALFLEESLYRGTQWVVFEPNDEPLWAQIRLNIGAFMQNLFRQGAFQGNTPREAYFVKCDKRDHDADRHQPRHRQHPRRLRAAEARRVRRHQDPADRRRHSDLTQPDTEESTMAQFSVNAAALRSVQELQVPGEVGRPLRRRHQQGVGAQAHDRGGRAPRGRRSRPPRASRRAAPSSRRSRSSAASPTTPSSRTGPTRSGTSAPDSAPRSR